MMMPGDDMQQFDFSTILIRNIPETLSEKALRELCKKSGRISYFKFLKDHAFCTYSDLRDAENGLVRLKNSSNFDLIVNFAKMRNPTSNRLSSKSKENQDEVFKESASGRNLNKTKRLVWALSRIKLKKDFVLSPKTELNGTFICSVMCENLKKPYSLLFDDFFNACTKASLQKVDCERDMLAVSVKEDGQISWYRALKLPNGSYGIIDVGTIAERCDVIDVIKCPAAFTHIPIFSCIFKPNNNNRCLKDDTFLCKIKEKKKDSFIVKLHSDSAVFGSLHYWLISDKSEFHHSDNSMVSHGISRFRHNKF